MPAIPEPQLALLPEDIRPQVKQAHDEALKNPKNASASGKLGMFLHAYHFDTEAAVCYRRAPVLDPTSFDWDYSSGLAQADQGEFADAAAALRQAVQHNPRERPTQIRRGE